MVPRPAASDTVSRVGSAMVSTGQGLADYGDYARVALPMIPTQSAFKMHITGDPQTENGHHSCSSPLRLEDLQPDVLHQVLLFLSNKDVGQLKQTSSKLRANTLQACQHWAPKVESWLMSDRSSSGLLRRLRELNPPSLIAGKQQLFDASMPSSGLQGSITMAIETADGVCVDESTSRAPGVQPQDQQQLLPTPAAVLQPREQDQRALQLSAANRQVSYKLPKWLDWRQVWTCIELAQRGPWQLDVQALAPAVSPNGVLLTFELLLQQPAPLVEPGSCEQPTMGWKDSVTVMSFVLDKKTVDIVVDTSGRVTSPQRDWCQGCIQLQRGQPRLLALEVSYLFPTPAWFLHPCTLAAPRPCSSASGSSSCASSISGMALDTAWDNYSTATSSSSMSISQSAILCSAAPSMHGDGCSLASSSLSSSSSMGNCTTVSGGSCANGGGRPRLSLDLSVGFGCFVQDPRYTDDVANTRHRGLDRIELSAEVCWRPSKVQSWLGRLLPGIRSHGSTSNSNNAHGSAGNGGSSSPRVGGAAGTTLVCNSSSSSSHKQGSKPSFSVTLSKAAAWQVPSDTDRRFAEGFMFWAVQHKLEQLLEHYGVLPRVMPHAVIAARGAATES